MLALVVAAGVSFVRYRALNLNAAGASFTAFFVDYEEKTRHEHWSEMVEKEQDPFIEKIFNNQKEYSVNWGLYNFFNLPTHFFYKTFHLRGINLWLANKLLATCMGIGVALLVFLIADLFYGPLVGLISSILMAFSPHIWVLYNFSADPAQPYNLFFSLLTIYFFLLFMERNRWYFMLISGFVMGINFLFFHVGSFLIPIIIFVFCIYNVVTKRRICYIGHFFIIALIAIFSGAALNYFHSSYLNLSFNPLITYIKNYISWGPTASHTIHGIMLFDWSKLVLNTRHHIQGVFINGKTQDWHHGASLPSIPMVYNYLISLFFAIACFIHIRSRKRKDVFFFIWFLTYFAIYSFIIFVRQKNIFGELPPVFILAASSVPVVGAFLYRKRESKWMHFLLRQKIKITSKSKSIYFLAILLTVSSMGIGSFIIFRYLPSKNFYSSYRAHYKIYQHFSKKGYTDKTKIIITSAVGLPDANMMMRLFTENIPQIINLTDFGIHQSTDNKDKNKWVQMESTLKENSDKMFYCFAYLDDHMWAKYSDEAWRNIFMKIHPESIPFDIKGLDGKIIWRIYEIE